MVLRLCFLSCGIVSSIEHSIFHCWTLSVGVQVCRSFLGWSIPFLHPSIHKSIHKSILLSIQPSVHPSIRSFTQSSTTTFISTTHRSKHSHLVPLLPRMKRKYPIPAWEHRAQPPTCEPTTHNPIQQANTTNYHHRTYNRWSCEHLHWHRYHLNTSKILNSTTTQ